MSNFELIDDYLRNKLSEDDKKSFEAQLESDLSLKAEVEFQSQIVEGLKRARAAELKAMLNQVPVSGGASIQFTPLRIAAGIVGIAALVTAAYFYYKGDGSELPKISTSVEDSVKQMEGQPEPKNEQAPVIQPEQTNQETPETISQKTESKSEVKKETSLPISPKEATKPALEVLDPSDEVNETASNPKATESISKPVISTAKFDVEVKAGTRKNGFHYQFSHGKVVLYGDFDKNLYEILEINGGKQLIFLYYKDSFYPLDESKTEITPLQAVTDKNLIQLLKEYRKP